MKIFFLYIRLFNRITQLINIGHFIVSCVICYKTNVCSQFIIRLYFVYMTLSFLCGKLNICTMAHWVNK